MYDYQNLKPELFTEAEQKTFLAIRDYVHTQLESAGAITMGKAINACTGDSWILMAHVDRLVELGEIREIPQYYIRAQDRIFVAAR